MSPEEIKSALTYNTGTFPLDAMSEAIAQREAITPILLVELERMAEPSPPYAAATPLRSKPSLKTRSWMNSPAAPASLH